MRLKRRYLLMSIVVEDKQLEGILFGEDCGMKRLHRRRRSSRRSLFGGVEFVSLDTIRALEELHL